MCVHQSRWVVDNYKNSKCIIKLFLKTRRFRKIKFKNKITTVIKLKINMLLTKSL